MTRSELKQTNYWYESGIDFIEGLRHRSKEYGFFKSQFGRMIATGAFDSFTPRALIDGLKVSPAFWAWWVDAAKDRANGLLIPDSVLLSIIDKQQNYGRHNETGKSAVARAAGNKVKTVAG